MIHSLKSYFHYILASKSRYKVHSPFVYDLIRNVLKESANHEYPTGIQDLRKEMMRDKSRFPKTDRGTGAMNGSRYEVSVKDIAKSSSTGTRKGKLLYRICKHFKPATVVELGTALGIGTAWLASAAPGARVYTVEGCPELAKRASENLHRLGMTHVEVFTGDFDNVLSGMMQEPIRADLVFIDGNHQKEALLNYFHRFLPHIHNDSVMILDDIHWSESMSEAWKTIALHDRVTVSVDLYHTGLVFFRKESSKQHYILRY